MHLRPISLIRIVVVDYDGGDMTVRCIASLLRTEWTGELEVVLVDNASAVPVVDEVRQRWPQVRTVRTEANRGFAGGANVGILHPGDADAIALVNNDAIVDPGWLDPLVHALESEPGLGAACPKIQFESQFVPVSIAAENRAARWFDRRALGVEVRGVDVVGPACEAVDTQVQYVRGFWGWEFDSYSGQPYQSTMEEAVLHVPVSPGPEKPPTARIQLRSEQPKRVALTSGSEEVELVVDAAGAVGELVLAATPMTVINNVGTELRPDWYGVDRGFHEPDDGRYEVSEDVTAWCGGAVLLRREYLDSSGLFDERLFLYYEDLELALRGAKTGWRYRYVPSSVVRHRHSATAVTGSDRAEYYKERNRLLVATRHAPLGELVPVIARFLVSTASYAWRDVLSSLLLGRRPNTTIVARRLRSFGGWLRLLPSMLVSRRSTKPRGRGNTEQRAES